MACDGVGANPSLSESVRCRRPNRLEYPPHRLRSGSGSARTGSNGRRCGRETPTSKRVGVRFCQTDATRAAQFYPMRYPSFFPSCPHPVFPSGFSTRRAAQPALGLADERLDDRQNFFLLALRHLGDGGERKPARPAGAAAAALARGFSREAYRRTRRESPPSSAATSPRGADASALPKAHVGMMARRGRGPARVGRDQRPCGVCSVGGAGGVGHERSIAGGEQNRPCMWRVN